MHGKPFYLLLFNLVEGGKNVRIILVVQVYYFLGHKYYIATTLRLGGRKKIVFKISKITNFSPIILSFFKQYYKNRESNRTHTAREQNII
jgi:hypothetical protein